MLFELPVLIAASSNEVWCAEVPLERPPMDDRQLWARYVERLPLHFSLVQRFGYPELPYPLQFRSPPVFRPFAHALP